MKSERKVRYYHSLIKCAIDFTKSVVIYTTNLTELNIESLEKSYIR